MRLLPLIAPSLTLGACWLALGACQPREPAPGNAMAPNAATAADDALPASVAAAPAAVPASYDWVFVTHGGSGELAFGDGDLAQGVALLRFSCLPASGRAEIFAEGQGRVSLRAGGQSFTPTDGVTLEHPVMTAFAATASITAASGSGERVLTAKPGAGRTAVESFFAYCAAAPAAG